MDSMGMSVPAGGDSRDVRPGRINGKNSTHRSGTSRIGRNVKEEILRVLEKNRDKSAHRDKRVGYVTQERRQKVILGFFSDLFQLGYKIKTIDSLKQKHLHAVFNMLEEKRQAPATIQQKISVMRTFCDWIGKPGMVIASCAYVKNESSVRRSMVVREDRSWEGHGIDVPDTLTKISQKDANVGMWLELCLAFGLRVQEAVMLRPNVAHEVDTIWLREGTKGDRPRVIPMEEQVQADVLERAKAMADKKTGKLGRRGKSVEQNIQRMYYVMRIFKLTLAEQGVSAHGLRHQYMHYAFKKLTGEEPPVRGGDLRKIEKMRFRIASQRLAERAGHTRVTIGASYYGSRRVRPAETKKT